MDDHTPPEPAVNPIPIVIIVLTLIMVLVEARFSAGATGFIGDQSAIAWRVQGLQTFGLNPAIFDFMVARGDFSFEYAIRFVTYPFVHASFLSALFGAALTLALGKFVSEQFGWWQTLVIFFGGSIAGAIVFCLIAPDTSPLFGAFTPVYAFIGGFTYMIWLRLGEVGGNQFAAFRLIGVLLGIQLVFGILFGAGNMWIAELAGFAFGFAVSTILAPGGWAQLLVRLRTRG